MKLEFKSSMLGRCCRYLIVGMLMTSLVACGGGRGAPGKPVGPGAYYV
jgi:hypothetical protein